MVRLMRFAINDKSNVQDREAWTHELFHLDGGNKNLQYSHAK